MELNIEAVKKIAHLAKFNLSEADLAVYSRQLSDILNFVEQMNQTDTSNIEPIAHSLDLPQRLREDTVTEINQRDIFLKLAPQTEAGLFLVPKVIE